jgi:hypothetical protein
MRSYLVYIEEYVLKKRTNIKLIVSVKMFFFTAISGSKLPSLTELSDAMTAGFIAIRTL